MVNLEIKEIGLNDINILQSFIEGAGNSTSSFRYFKSRPLSIIANHLLTVVVLDNVIPIAYGHLDKEGDVIWLGIAVSESCKGKGIGKLIMNYLINFSDTMNIPELFLSVDKENTIATSMYKKYNFKETKTLENRAVIMKRKMINEI